ncbi:MAG: patatin-like phospholipase family protein [Bacteroidales bacterium]|nr:patatin-like phospholipase family protein [Bacteroidales bacterium]
MNGRWVLIGGLIAALTGCVPSLTSLNSSHSQSPIEAGLNPVELLDLDAQSEASHALNLNDLYSLGEMIREERKPAVLPQKRSILALSGGGSFGAYSAGVLCGWTEAGTRPRFDVVTGVSTGALIAPLAFLGPQYNPQLQELYTTAHNHDIFRLKDPISSLLSDAVADSTPMAKGIARMVTPEFLAAIATEHRAGRRLYVGTTSLDTGRQVVWDLGAIACRGTDADGELFRKVLLASAAVPGFFPPVHLPVEVGEQKYEERHVDGGVTAALFFRPPYVPPEHQNDPRLTSLYDSDLYLIVAGKLYPDPNRVRDKAIAIASNSVATLISSQTRGDLVKLYTACVLTGMNFHLTAIPPTFQAPASSVTFDPTAMSRMFEEGRSLAKTGRAWRATPPGVEPGEGVFQRSGGSLTRVPLTEQ